MAKVNHIPYNIINENLFENFCRVNIHEKSNDLQSMVIHMPANYSFPYIKDDINGEICFFVIEGSITIKVLDENVETTYNLNAKDMLYLKRNIFRSTSTMEQRCIYLENISGGYHPEKRIRLDESNNQSLPSDV